MSPDTPLTEVAQMLPDQAARLLLYEPPYVQTFATTVVRNHMLVWEDHHIVLDPVAFEVVILSVVVQAIATAHHIEKLEGLRHGPT